MMMNECIVQIRNAANTASKRGIARFTRFLDPAQVYEAKKAAAEYGCSLSLYGGYERAERAVACFHDAYEQIEPADYPIECLIARKENRFSSISHRDILGAFMALGLTRDCIGDMILTEDEVYIFALDHVSEYICQALKSAGRVGLSFKKATALPDIPEPSGREFKATVSSLRLDAVLAAGYRLSRAEASELIRAGAVKVNHLPCEKTDKELTFGDLLSVRGKGRIRLQEINGMTKKQRIGITLFQYQ